MGRASRAKGSRAELEVASLLEAWWRRLEPECVFRRTPGSGGLRGANGRHDAALFQMAGDLMTTAERFPFSTEIKRREGWSLPNFLAGRKSPIWGWWEQAQRDAAAQSLMPMLWFRKSREPWRVAVSRSVQLRGLCAVYVPKATSIGMKVVLAEDLLSTDPGGIVCLP